MSKSPSLTAVGDSLPRKPAGPASAPLRPFEFGALIALVILMLAYGVLVVIRSAFLSRPFTDLGCFLHAAWAVRTGNDIYSVTFNDWYYNYPSLLAIFLVPLALPPAGQDTAWMLPMSISSAIWYLLSAGFLFWGVHRLAGALEEKSGERIKPRSRRWWMLRTLPIWACLISIGSAQGHGQSNLLVLALACGMIAAVLRGQAFQAGVWMAGAICVKVFPLFLILYPLWRRDGRCLAGCAVGLLAGLFLIPSLVFGPTQALAYNHRLVQLVVLPALSDGQDTSRADTLTKITSTDTQSFMAMMHNSMYLDRNGRPDQVSPMVFRLHLLIAGSLTLLTLFAGGWNHTRSAPKEATFLGMLLVIMMLTSPVCHLHYFPWLIPLMMGLIQWQWQRGAPLYLGLGWMVLFIGNNVVHILAHMRDMNGLGVRDVFIVRDLGICSYVALILWFLGWAYLTFDKRLQSNIQPSETHRCAA